MVTSGAVHSPAAMVNRFIQRNAVPSQAAAAYAAFLMGGHGSNFVPTGVSQQGPSNGAPSTAPKQNVYSAVPYVSAEMQSIGPDSLAVPHTATATATATVNNQASYQSHLPGQRSYYGPQPTASAPATVSSSGIGQKRRYNTEEDANGRPEYTCQWGGQCGAKIAPRSSAVRAHIKEDHAGDTWCRETIVRGIAQLCSFTLCRWPGCSKAGVEMKVQCIGRHIETHLQSCGVVCPACNRVLCRSDALLRHLRMKPACRDLLAQARAHPAVHPGEDESGEDRMEKRPRY